MHHHSLLGSHAKRVLKQNGENRCYVISAEGTEKLYACRTEILIKIAYFAARVKRECDDENSILWGDEGTRKIITLNFFSLQHSVCLLPPEPYVRDGQIERCSKESNGPIKDDNSPNILVIAIIINANILQNPNFHLENSPEFVTANPQPPFVFIPIQ